MADVVMPRLSDTMEEGTILRWFKRDGEHVERGEELVEIETDKASMPYASDQSGVLSIVAEEGATLAVGEVIARIGDGDGAETEADTSAGTAADTAEASTAGPNDDEGPAREGPAGGVRAENPPASAQPAEPGAPTPAGERVKASPLARRLAQGSGVDLRSLTGSGPGGRIVKADVLGARDAGAGATGGAPAATGAPSAASAGAPGPEAVMTAKGETTAVELSRPQQTVARRMAESKATIPDFTLHIDVDMEACVALRAQLKELATPARTGEGTEAHAHEAPTYNDMVVKAAALALREHPRANGSYRDGRVQLYSRVNVGVAVAAQDALVVPTLFDADAKALGEIAREARALAERVRAGTITPPELGGGTFTVSNLGMYGVRGFTAIINPPQAGILSVGALAQRAVAHEGELAVRHTMTLTLACDHRILYGAEAALLLARIRELLEAPASLTL